jgi:FkbM family methyltransferase
MLRRCLQPRATRLAAGFRMYLDPLEWTQIALLSDSPPEAETIRRLQGLLRSGDTYVDVGAHVGFHSLVARGLVGPSGRIIAVEPQPYNCDRLLQNWHVNGYANLSLFVAVAGESRSMVHLHSQQPTDSARLSLVLHAPNDLPQEFCVPMIRLEDVLPPLADVPRVRLLKIDAEGFEAEVLRGLGSSVERIDNIVTEVLEETLEQRQRSAETLEVLRSGGFQLYDVRGRPYEAGAFLIDSNLWASRAPIEQVAQGQGA